MRRLWGGAGLVKQWPGRVLMLMLVVALLGTVAGCGNEPATSSQRPAAPVSPELAFLTELADNTATGADLDRKLPDSAQLAPELQAIRARGYLIVAMIAEDQYPFLYVDGKGDLVGVDVSMARDISRRLGVGLRFDREAKTFDALVDRLATGAADIAISKFTATLPRAQRVLFTQPYINLRQTLLVNRTKIAELHAEPNDPTIINQPGRRVGVLAGSSYVDFAQQRFPRADLVEMDDPDEMFAMVVDGDLIAYLYDEPVIKRLVQNRPESLLYVDMQLAQDQLDPIAMAVPWSSSWLHQWLNLYLDLNNVQWTVEQLFEVFEEPL